jgi:hypothetical protein
MRLRWIKSTILGTALVLVPFTVSDTFALAASTFTSNDDDKDDDEEDEECDDDECEEKEHSKKHKKKSKQKKHKKHAKEEHRPSARHSAPVGPHRGPPIAHRELSFRWKPSTQVAQFPKPWGMPPAMQSPHGNQPNHQAEMIELLGSINRSLKSIESMMREERGHRRPDNHGPDNRGPNGPGMSGPSMHVPQPGQSWPPMPTMQFVPQGGAPAWIQLPANPWTPPQPGSQLPAGRVPSNDSDGRENPVVPRQGPAPQELRGPDQRPGPDGPPPPRDGRGPDRGERRPDRGPESGGPDRGGPERGGPDRGGPDRGGPDRGGPERGGPDRGGPERGGPERGLRPERPSEIPPSPSDSRQ